MIDTDTDEMADRRKQIEREGREGDRWGRGDGEREREGERQRD